MESPYLKNVQSPYLVLVKVMAPVWHLLLQQFHAKNSTTKCRPILHPLLLPYFVG